MTEADLVIEAGLLVLPLKGAAFPGRGAEPLPYLVDSRGAGTNLELRRAVVNALHRQVGACAAHDVIAGVSRGGTTWGAWLAWLDNKPYAGVLLDGPRTSGLQREVEGDVQGKRVLLVDNWIRSGESIRKAVEVVRRAGGIPVGVVSIVRTGQPDVGVPVHAAWQISDLVASAEKAAAAGSASRPLPSPTYSRATGAVKADPGRGGRGASSLGWDADGVLVDSRSVAWRAAEEIAALFGKRLRITTAEHKARVFGRRALGLMAGEDGAPILQAMHRVVMRDRARNVGVFRDVLDIAASLDERPRLITAAYSSGVRKALGPYVSLFRDIAGCEIAPKDALLATAAAAGLKWFITDTVTDIHRCRASGVKVIAVGWGYDLPAELVAAGPDEIAVTPAELRQILTRLSFIRPDNQTMGDGHDHQ